MFFLDQLKNTSNSVKSVTSTERTPNATRKTLLERFRELQMRQPVERVFFANAAQPPVKDAIITKCSRLSLAFKDAHPMQLATHDGIVTVSPVPGEAVFIRHDSWNAPNYEGARDYGAIDFQSDHLRFFHRRLRQAGSRSLWFHTAVPLTGAGVFALRAMEILSGGRATPKAEAAHLARALIEFALDVLQNDEAEASGIPRMVRSIRDFVVEHMHEDLGRDRLAAEFQLHPNHVSRLFSGTGESLKQFIIRVRMERAAGLDRNHKLTVEEIAVRCGYQDAAYFRACYKRYWRIELERQ